MEKKKNYLSVMLSFLKVGTIGFGGGAVLLPLFERELVENKQWMDKENFDVAVAVSSISPASLPVSLCTIWNSRFSLLSAYAYALPGSLIYLVLLTGFSFIGEVGAEYLRFASVGLIAFVLFLLFRFVGNNILSSAKSGIKMRYLSVMAAAFLLTGGNVVRRLLSVLFGLTLPPSIFSINMIILILITFFVICFTGNSKSKIKLCTALLIGGIYALSNGKMGILGKWSLALLVIMIVLAAASILYDVIKNRENREEKKPFKFDRKPLRNLSFFILIAVTLTVLTFVVSKDANVWDYAGKVLSSSFSLFGGGEVYIGISETTFVHTGFIPEQIFNTQIVGIANTMPGPVLMSVVTGVGYTYGNIMHGVGFGWLFGLLGFVLAVTATATGALSLYTVFELLKNSRRLRMVVQYIMPVVCGMLVSTALSLLIQSSSVLRDMGTNAFLSIGIVIAIFLAIAFLHRKFRLNDLILLILSGAGTVTVLGLLA